MRTVLFAHTPPTGRRALVWCLACCLNVLIAPAAMAQDRGLAIEYTVKVADIPGQLFHVTTDIKNINQPALDLSLPVWSPGWYVIENYAKNVFRFRVTEPGGGELRHALVRKQTWRIDTSGISRVTVEFDYLANVLSANQARIAADFVCCRNPHYSHRPCQITRQFAAVLQALRLHAWPICLRDERFTSSKANSSRLATTRV